MIKTHSFDTELACKIGVNEAIIVGFIAYWVYENALNGRNEINGRFWTYNTSKAMSEHFAYFTQSQIKNILLKLEKEGVLISDNFNKNKFNRTKWYTLSDEYLYLIDDSKSEAKQSTAQTKHSTAQLVCSIAENEQSTAQLTQSLMNNNQDNSNTISNNNSNTISNESAYAREQSSPRTHKSPAPKDLAKPKTPKFQKPTPKELEAYKLEQSLNLDTRYFYDYYESNGWQVGKNKMKDWRATMRNWSRRENNQAKEKECGLSDEFIKRQRQKLNEPSIFNYADQMIAQYQEEQKRIGNE